ncbi:MICAL-like protein 1 isoform X2 [Centropristis striata]|uniref:MICAL-like protein 1 isoform X2 n=1 Tax=Centropristis striata TaxID=184440 RepID=UPI0027E19B88|nr:MICAL-like protein 1 isoform X2 [Centropristis striata]
MEAPRSAHFWAEDESALMLTLLKERNILKYMDGRKTRNGNLFKKVAEQMREGGFSRTPEQVRIRWKHLKKNYYDARKNNFTSGHNRVACPFGDALEELLGPKPLSQVEHHEEDIGFEGPLDAASSPSPQASPQPQPQSSSSKRPANFSTGPTRWKKTKFETLEAFARAMSSNDDELQLQMQRAQHAHENRLCDRVMQSIESLASTLSSALRPPAPSTPSHPGQLSWYQPMPPQPSQPAPAGPSLMPHPPVENGGIMPSNGIKEEEQGEITTKTPQSSPATSNPHIRPDVSNEDVGLTSSHSTNLSTSLLSASQGTRDAVDVASNTTSNERYVTEESTAATSDGQLHVIKTEIRVPTGSDSTEHFIRPEAAISTCSDLDTMDLDQLKREKIKMQLKVLKLQDEYYTLKINNLKK